MAKQPTFKQKLESRKALGDQTDELDEAIVTEFLTAAAPVIQMLRDIQDNMSDGVSFAARAKQVLSSIDTGLLRDPLSIRVVDAMRSAQEAAKISAEGEPVRDGSSA